MNGDFYEKRTVSDDNRHNISNAVSYASVATAQSLDAAVTHRAEHQRLHGENAFQVASVHKTCGNVPEYLRSPQDDALLGCNSVPGKESGIH